MDHIGNTWSFVFGWGMLLILLIATVWAVWQVQREIRLFIRRQKRKHEQHIRTSSKGVGKRVQRPNRR